MHGYICADGPVRGRCIGADDRSTFTGLDPGNYYAKRCPTAYR